ncbi:hypothetical protein D9V29_05910 [Mycetocola manganoxydans]|uniref:Uncharacterized protein n=1 Tax=Mycetocola manganoxydans TaxID=699879 RepID=A0A3L6ZVY7_9MICO|nr:hypothetical protein D9V29_05910 [Mycetocola manganoxydans]
MPGGIPIFLTVGAGRTDGAASGAWAGSGAATEEVGSAGGTGSGGRGGTACPFHSVTPSSVISSLCPSGVANSRDAAVWCRER